MIKQNLMVTVSGGRSSAMMARHIQISEKYKDYHKVFVFCNTGLERPETIDFLKNIEKHWDMPLNLIEGVYSLEMGVGVNYKVFDWETLDMTGKPFKQMIKHKNKGIFKGLPNQDAPYCSENTKTTPAKKICDSIFGINNYKKAIGYRKEDMPRRISWAEIREDETRIYPLITDFQNPISQFDLNVWWDKQPFKLGIHGKFGNCELCWKKSDNNLSDNIRFGSRFITYQKQLEIQYNSTSFRNHKSIDDLVKLAQQPFTQEIEFESEYFKCVCNF